jgi:hypothetical protein
MSKIALSGNASGTGTLTIASPNTNTDRTLTLPDGTGTVAVNGVNGVLVSDTAKSATSTSVDFDSIPSWVKRITVMLNGVSTNGTSTLLIQIGAGSVLTSTYVSSNTTITSSNVSGSTSTAGFLFGGSSAANIVTGNVVLTNITGNVWVGAGAIVFEGTVASALSAGKVTLSGSLDRVRITTTNGTDTFDAGTINILYE